MAKKTSETDIEQIIARELPLMRVVKRKKSSVIVRPDAKTPAPTPGLNERGLAPDAEWSDDDVQIVNVEPKERVQRDATSDGDQVVLVSKSRKKIIAMRG